MVPPLQFSKSINQLFLAQFTLPPPLLYSHQLRDSFVWKVLAD